jgi:hypothetical protein
MAATSLEVPSDDDIRIILCSATFGGVALSVSVLGAIGLALCTICSCALRAALEEGVFDAASPSVGAEAFTSLTGEGGRKLIEVAGGAEQEYGKDIDGSTMLNGAWGIICGVVDTVLARGTFTGVEEGKVVEGTVKG